MHVLSMGLLTSRRAHTPGLIALAALLLIAAIGILGYRSYQRQADEHVDHRLQELAVLGSLQVAAMDAWIAERTGDVSVLASSPVVAGFLESAEVGGPAPVGLTRLVAAVANTFDYDAVVLVDSMGVMELVRSSAAVELTEGTPVPAVVTRALVEARSIALSGLAVSGEVHRGMDPGDPHFVYFVGPVADDRGEPVGGVVFVVDPARHEFTRVLAQKRLGGEYNRGVDSFVVHEDGGVVMTVVADPPGSAKALSGWDDASTSRVVSLASTGSPYRTVERDAEGETWLTAGVWSSRLGMGFVNRQSRDVLVASLQRTALLGTGIAQLAVVALAGLVLALWRGARLKTLAAVRKIEEEKAALEGRLVQAERLEVVGRLAGGVAHDFNNLLAVVIGHLELADASIGAGPVRDDLEVARSAAVRAARIGRQLLSVGRRQVLELAPLDVRTLMAGAAESLKGMVPTGVEIEVHAPAALASVHADGIEIERAVFNLVLNAVEAVGDAGRVTLAAMDRTVSESLPAVNGEIVPAAYVVLRVQDDGPGMAEATRSRVFEPFFTTKGDRRGGGLGLASVLGVVSQHGGFLTLATRPGEGALFEVYLPALGDVANPARPRSPEGPPPSAVPVEVDEAAPGRRATILVVDDEAGIRQFVARVLGSCGYEVVSAASAEEAESLWRECGPLDLLVSDVLMPGGTGVDLLVSLRSLQPGLRAVLISGYAAGPAFEQGKGLPGCRFLAKPFSTEELLAEVGRMLEAPASPGAGPEAHRSE